MDVSIWSIRWFIDLARIAVEVRDYGADWEGKYDYLFGKFISDVRETGIQFDWYDPDTSYEDDVNAFVNALQDKANELSKIIQAVDAAVNGER